MSAYIRLDRSGFDQALADYSRATGKSMAQAANRAMASLAVMGMKEAKVASEAEINALESKPYWVKVVAKALSGRREKKFANARARSAERAMQTGRRARKVRRLKAYKLGASSKALKGTRFAGRGQYSEQAHRYSRKIIRSRLGRVRFLRFFFGALAREAQRYYKIGFVKPGKSFGGFKVEFHPAMAGFDGRAPHLSAWAKVVYDFKKRGQKSAAGVERLLQGVLDTVAPRQMQDMQDFASRELKRLGAQYSARAA